MIFIFIIYGLLIFLVNSEKKQIIESDILQRINSFSYGGISQQLHHIGLEYSLLNYVKHLLVLCSCLGVICYLTTRNIIVTVIVAVAYALCLPYLVFIQKLQKNKERLLSNIFIYTESLLMYLREDKTVIDMLRETEESLDGSIREDLMRTNDYIAQTTDIVSGLKLMENKYKYSIVINTHIILSHKVIDGIVNADLIDYVFMNIENYELSLQEFLAKRKSNTFLFYLIIVLNAIGVLSLTNFIQVQQSEQSALMVSILLIYYLLNLGTILLYEKWCLSSLSIE